MKTIKEKELPAEESSTVIIPIKNALVKQTADIDGFIQKRQDFIQKVAAICVEGKDYHIIQGKKSLAKGGAEKIASIFQWVAKFVKDEETWDMIGKPTGTIVYMCYVAKDGHTVGQGRGAAVLSKNAGDPNKTIKMAQKSAFIDAVLRASGLSDFFTQDLEDMNPSDVGHPHQEVKSFPPSDKQIDLIKSVMEKKNVSEADLFDEGFNLKELTGGKEGTASKLIEWLFNFKGYGRPQGITPITDEDRRVTMYTKDLEQCQSAQEYEKVCIEIKIARDNKGITELSYQMLVKTAKVIITKFQ